MKGLYCRACYISNCKKCHFTSNTYVCDLCADGYAYDASNFQCVNIKFDAKILVGLNMVILLALTWVFGN
jgi:recombinational DNA repair protein RecR